MSPPKIPAYRVEIWDTSVRRKLCEGVFREGPVDNDASLVRCQTEPDQQWSHVSVRLRSAEGDYRVVSRHRGQNTIEEVGKPGQDVFVTQANHRYQVKVEALPEDQWQAGKTVAFKPPRARITGLPGGGWQVTFAPQQFPCVLTVAFEALGVKPEGLPSVPFPAHPQHLQGTLQIPANSYPGVAAGSTIRLGVRGAGLSATGLPLPAPGQTVEVPPDQFLQAGAADPNLLTEAYVLTKYNEKKGNIVYNNAAMP